MPALASAARGCLIFAFSSACVLIQTHTTDLHTRFERETDPIRRAKLMPRLGEEQFRDIAKEISDGNFSEALTIVKQYRDEAQSSIQGLDAKVVDPEKHAAGFKELEISVRESLRRLDEMLVGMTANEQRPFLEVRGDLDRLNRRLVRELFPRQPNPDDAASKKKGTAK